MSTKNVGIKLYNDDFVPVLKSDEIKSKRLILTTVRNNQKKAIIELYEGKDTKCINNEYLGMLTININRDTQKGEPAIEVNLRQDKDGILYAKAWDPESTEQSEIKIEHSLSRKILHETMPDETIKEEQREMARIISYEKSSNMGNFLKIAILICSVLIILGLLTLGIWFLNKKYGPAIAQTIKNIFPQKKEKVIEKKEEKKKEEKTEEKKESVIQEKKEEKKQEFIGKKDAEGEKYFIRWGDNLWNICKKKYGDPWYYPSLAEKNNIKNPRLIFAGTYIILPTKSELKKWDFLEK